MLKHDNCSATPALLFALIQRWLPEKLLSIFRRSACVFFLYLAAMLLLFFVIERITSRARQLPSESYEQAYLVIELLSHFGVFSIGFLLVIAVAFTRFGALMSGWQSLEHGSAIRGFIVFLTVIIAWPFVTYGYNYYFDQAHFVDRAALLLLVPLIWWRPVFVLPFLVLVYAVFGQITELALGGSILPHKTQVLKVLELFSAAFLIHAITGYRRTDLFVYLTACFVAAAYWLPALAKFQLDWISAERLNLIPLTAYAHGWLASMSPERVVAFAEKLSVLNAPMRVATIVIEAAFLIFLWKRRFSATLLLAAIVFHCAVFALYGFFFWTWIALDSALLLLLRSYWHGQNRMYSRMALIVSVPLIGFGAWWADPPALAWYDTPLAYSYRIEATTTDGEVMLLHPRFFAPYEDVFTMAGFGYLQQHRTVLVGPYGATHDQKIRDALFAARTPVDIFALELAKNPRSHDARRSEKFYRFLTRFVRNRNFQGDRAQTLYALHSPLQFWSQNEGEQVLGDRKISELRVYELTFFFDGNTLEMIRKEELNKIVIPSDEESLKALA